MYKGKVFSKNMIVRILTGLKTNFREVCKEGEIPEYEAGDLIFIKEPFRLQSWGENQVDFNYQSMPLVKRWLSVDDEVYKSIMDDVGKELAGTEFGELPKAGYWNENEIPLKWKSAEEMEKWSSRFSLKIIKVKSELLQNVKTHDLRFEEGFLFSPGGQNDEEVLNAFVQEWDENHGAGEQWDDNPRVTVYKCKLHF